MSGARVEARTYAPSSDLGDVIATHWVGRWDLRGAPPHVTELLGDPSVNIVFERGGPGPGDRLVGVWTRLWRRTLEGRGLVRGAKLRAGAVRALVAAPAVRFTNRIVPLEQVFADDLSPVTRAVLGPDDDQEALANLEAWLRARRTPAEEQGQVSLAVALVERIARDGEIVSVERLAAVAGLGPRALQRLFREHVGASPKWVIRRNRLQEVALRLERGDAVTLAALAADLGYTDQAHLARDFKAVVGKSPSAFAESVRR